MTDIIKKNKLRDAKYDFLSSFIKEALALHNGSIRRSAEYMDIHYSQLMRLLKRLKIDPKSNDLGGANG